MALFISIFAAFMLIGALIGVLMLIPVQTRKAGLRLALFCIIILLSISLINNFFLKYENEPVATITPEEYKKIKEGMTYDEVKKIVGGKAKSVEKVGHSSSKFYDFDGEGGLENDAEVSLYFVAGELSFKSEYGLITKNNQSELNHSSTENETSDTRNIIEDLVDKHLKNVSIEDIEVNQNLGHDKKDQYITLVHLSFDLKNSPATTKKIIELYSEDLAARLAEEDTSVSELSVFWKAPYIDEDETLENSLIKDLVKKW